MVEVKELSKIPRKRQFAAWGRKKNFVALSRSVRSRRGLAERFGEDLNGGGSAN